MRLIIEEDKIIIDGIEYAPVKKEIQVGDTVRVKNPGKCYTSYWSWPGWKEAPIEYAIGYQYFGGTPDTEENYVVRYIGLSGTESKKLAIIEETLFRRCYLVDVKGLEKVE